MYDLRKRKAGEKTPTDSKEKMTKIGNNIFAV